MSLTIEIAIAKTSRAGTRESGDTVELVERPGGGISVVLVDGQGWGLAAKRLSLQIAGRVISLLNEGVRDGAAARAAHDYLYTSHGGRVSAELDIVSVDLASRTLVITRNSQSPLLLARGTTVSVVDSSGGRIGLYRHTRPSVTEYPLEPGLTAVVVSDGVAHAGQRWNDPLDVVGTVRDQLQRDGSVQQLAEELLAAAVTADRGHPQDDMSVVVLSLRSGGAIQPIRRLTLELPLPE